MSDVIKWMLIIMVIVAVQVLLQIVAAKDLGKRQRVPGGNKWVWVAVILMSIPGPLVYFAFGRLPNGDPPST